MWYASGLGPYQLISDPCNFSNIKKAHYILFLLVIVEISCNALLYGLVKSWVHSVLYLSIGFLIPILIWKRNVELIKTGQASESYTVSKEWVWGICLLFGFIFQYYMEELIQSWPLDYTYADMLPVIQIMAERYLQGESAYAIIPKIWGGMQPIYLPGMWLPMVPNLSAGIDVRWTTWLFIFIGSVFLLTPWKSEKRSLIEVLLISIAVFYLWLNFLFLDTGMLALTEEGIVIGYYLFLCWAIFRQNGILIGIAAALCLMSRYSLAPWWIMICAVTFVLGERKLFIHMCASCIASILILMTMGQAWGQLDIFRSVPENYLSSILENKGKYEDLINSSLGMAKFWKYEHLESLHTLMKGSSLITPALCSVIYYFNKSQIDWRWFALLSLKLSLVVFYNLLIIPYSYLFYTSTAISVFILVQVLQPKHELFN